MECTGATFSQGIREVSSCPDLFLESISCRHIFSLYLQHDFQKKKNLDALAVELSGGCEATAGPIMEVFQRGAAAKADKVDTPRTTRATLLHESP